MSNKSAERQIKDELLLLKKRKKGYLLPEFFLLAQQRFVPSCVELAIANVERGGAILVCRRVFKGTDINARINHSEVWGLGSSRFPGEKKRRGVKLDLLEKFGIQIDHRAIFIPPGADYNFMRNVVFSGSSKVYSFHNSSSLAYLEATESYLNMLTNAMEESNNLPGVKFEYKGIDQILPGAIVSDYRENGKNSKYSEALSCLANDIILHNKTQELLKLKSELGNNGEIGISRVWQKNSVSNLELQDKMARINRNFILPKVSFPYTKEEVFSMPTGTMEF